MGNCVVRASAGALGDTWSVEAVVVWGSVWSFTSYICLFFTWHLSSTWYHYEVELILNLLAEDAKSSHSTAGSLVVKSSFSLTLVYNPWDFPYFLYENLPITACGCPWCGCGCSNMLHLGVNLGASKWRFRPFGWTFIVEGASTFFLPSRSISLIYLL